VTASLPEASLPAEMNAPVPPQVDSAGATPVMAQFFETKARQPDALVFFRMGDFYELFFDDARQAAAALGIALTARGQHAGEPIPMCGVPVHAAEAYLSKLIRSGFKVAVCEQMEDPAEARKRGSKAIVRRDIVRVVTPGTLTEDGLLDARGANRLAAVAVRAGAAAIASVELSTGEVEVWAPGKTALASALAALGPSEILVPDRLFADEAVSAALKAAGGRVQPLPSALAEPGAAEARLKRLYGVETLDGFGALSGAEVSALGLIAAHLETTQAGRTPSLAPPRRAGEADVMAIDETLKGQGDMARALSRLALGRGGPRDLGGLRDGLAAGGALRALFEAAEGPLEAPPPVELAECLAALDLGRRQELADLHASLSSGLGPDLPLQARDGGFVAPGVRPELDEARRLRDDSRRVILSLEAELAAQSGVALKIRHNGVLGYFIEATAKAAEPLLRPPLNATFIHRQTLASQMRFTTVALAELDARIAQAGERALGLRG